MVDLKKMVDDYFVRRDDEERQTKRDRERRRQLRLEAVALIESVIHPELIRCCEGLNERLKTTVWIVTENDTANTGVEVHVMFDHHVPPSKLQFQFTDSPSLDVRGSIHAGQKACQTTTKKMSFREVNKESVHDRFTDFLQSFLEAN